MEQREFNVIKNKKRSDEFAETNEPEITHFAFRTDNDSTLQSMYRGSQRRKC